MIVQKWGPFHKIIIIGIIGACIWFFIFRMPSMTVCKLGYKNQTNTLLAIASIVDGKFQDIVPLEKIYTSWSMIRFLWPISFPILLLGILTGELLRKFTIEEKISNRALEKISDLNFSNAEKKIAILNYLKEIRERTQDYPAILSANKQLKTENNRLNLNCGMQKKQISELEKDLESKDKELQKARSKIQRLDKKTSREKTLEED